MSPVPIKPPIRNNVIGHAAQGVTAALQGWPHWFTTAVLLIGAIVAAKLLHAVLVRSVPRIVLDRRPILKILILNNQHGEGSIPLEPC